MMEDMTLTEPSRRSSGVGSALRQGLRTVAGAALHPMVPADVLDLVHPLRRGAELRGRVVEVRPEH